MTGQQTLIARGALAILAGAVSIPLSSSTYLRRLPSLRFDRLAAAAFLITRLGLFAAIFFILRLAPRGDVPAYYWPEALSVLRGQLPYRDFLSSYAPLHPYLDAIAVRIWHTPLAIILLAILVEAALLPLWLRFGRTLLSETELRTATLLYLSNAVSLQFVAVDGQDTIIVAVFFALSLLLLVRRRELISGVSVGTAIAAVKFLPLVYVPVFFLTLVRRWRWMAGFAIPVLLVYGTSVAMHLPILVPLQHEGNIKEASNLPYLVETLLGISLPSRLWDLFLLVALAALFFLVGQAARAASHTSRLRVVTFAFAAVTLTLLLFSKKSWPPYLMLALFPICLLLTSASKLQLSAFAGFSVVAVLEHSYWSTLLHQMPAQELHRGLLSGQPIYLLFLTLDLLLLAGYSWLLSLSLQRIRSAPHSLPVDEAGVRPAQVTS